MTARGSRFRYFLSALALAGVLLAGCAENHGPSMSAIPRYANSTPGEMMQGSTPGGFMGVSLEQYTTTDSFDQVFEFYREELKAMSPQVLNERCELGRMSAFAIPVEDGMITVGVQEFTEEGTVNITLSSMGA